MPQAKKRPASAMRRPALAYLPEPGLGDGDEPWFERILDADAPDWASHCLRVLMPSFELLKRRMGDRIRIVCWADCAGMGVELFALEIMATRVKEHLGVSVEIVPYAFCDKSEPAQKFAALNHMPRHIITDMMERDFEAGTSH